MPTISKNNNDTSKIIKDDRVEQLQKQNKELEEKLNLILNMLSQSNKTVEQSATQPIVVPAMEETEVYKEPEANKNIKVMSLVYGTLNLSDGIRSPIKFDKFGQVKNILYSTLISIVNQQTSFAEEGKFYICDKSAVYNLGLENAYRNIFDYNTLTNICSFSNVELEDIMGRMNDSQKEVLTQDIVTRLDNGESFDLNKLDIINKYTKINFQAELEDYKKYNNLRKK